MMGRPPRSHQPQLLCFGQMQAASAHSDTQLATANAQILYLIQMLESVRADQERLRRESEAAFNSFESRTQGRTGGTREREVSFVNMKSFEGGRFAGGKAESFQAWAKRVRIYCNALSSGMKKATETAEASTREVDVRSLGLADPRLAEELDAKLTTSYPLTWLKRPYVSWNGSKTRDSKHGVS